MISILTIKDNSNIDGPINIYILRLLRSFQEKIIIFKSEMNKSKLESLKKTKELEVITISPF
jgi:hypothetical protein